MPLPAPMDVQHTTSALSTARWTSSRALALAASFSSLSLVTPQAFAAISSAQYSRSSGRDISGRPSRTTRTPCFASPSTRLSTAMLESLVASSAVFLPHRISREPRTQCCMIRSAVDVFPVPGGPCTRVSDARSDSLMARTWLSFMPAVSTATVSLTPFPSSSVAGIFASAETGPRLMIVRMIAGAGLFLSPRCLCLWLPLFSSSADWGCARRCSADAMRVKLVRLATLSTLNFWPSMSLAMIGWSLFRGFRIRGRDTRTSHSHRTPLT
mmetsp:Transcript_99165/g.280612  ORF Transcript_99165/g.280612 Transcript_99165/m.280612 type:complete len:269 (-) Transcript_99165:580-1386(-)